MNFKNHNLNVLQFMIKFCKRYLLLLLLGVIINYCSATALGYLYFHTIERRMMLALHGVGLATVLFSTTFIFIKLVIFNYYKTMSKSYITEKTKSYILEESFKIIDNSVTEPCLDCATGILYVPSKKTVNRILLEV